MFTQYLSQFDLIFSNDMLFSADAVDAALALVLQLRWEIKQTA